MTRDRGEQSDLDWRPQPPILSWIERYRGARGQLPLPGMGDSATAAERVLVELVERWAHAVQASDDPRAADVPAFAALLYASEYDVGWTPSVRFILDDANRIAEQSDRSGCRQLVWELASDLVADPIGHRGISALIENLDHHKSWIRHYMIRLGWIVRSHLPVEETLARVFSTLEDGDTHLAPGLGVAVAGSLEQFLAAGHEWQGTERKRGLYLASVAEVEADGALRSQSQLWRIEAQCRSAIVESCMSVEGVRRRRMSCATPGKS